MIIYFRRRRLYLQRDERCYKFIVEVSYIFVQARSPVAITHENALRSLFGSSSASHRLEPSCHYRPRSHSWKTRSLSRRVRGPPQAVRGPPTGRSALGTPSRPQPAWSVCREAPPAAYLQGYPQSHRRGIGRTESNFIAGKTSDDLCGFNVLRVAFNIRTSIINMRNELQ